MERFTAVYYSLAAQTGYNFVDPDATSKLQEKMMPLLRNVGYDFDIADYILAETNFRDAFWRETALKHGYAELAYGEYTQLSAISSLHTQRCQAFSAEVATKLYAVNVSKYSPTSRIRIVNSKSKFDNLEAGNYKAYNKVPEGTSSTRPYTKSSLKMGQEMHKAYKADVVDNITKFKEFRLPSGKRIDFIDFETKTIYELKPYNPNGIKTGLKQLEVYLKEVESIYGGGWKTILDTY